MTGATYNAPPNKAAATGSVEATTKSRTNSSPTGTTTEAPKAAEANKPKNMEES
jgi:hypothetical protein